MEHTVKQSQYMIGGVPVMFPCKPYPSQIAMMAKIMRALEKGENALLESPTGSGKSLALLCACLAWQKHMQEKLTVEKQKTFDEYQSLAASQQENTKLCQCHCHRGGTDVTCNSSGSSAITAVTPSAAVTPSNVNKTLLTSPPASTIKVEVLDEDEVKECTVDHCKPNLDQEVNNSIQKCVDSEVKTDQIEIKKSQEQSNCGVVNSTSGHQNVTEAVVVKCENTEDVARCSSHVELDEDDDFKPPKKKYRLTGRKRRGIIYDDEEEEEGKCDNSTTQKQSSILTTQQESDSSGHPVWKMQLVGDNTQTQQAPVSDSSSSMMPTATVGIGSNCCATTTEVTTCNLCACGAMKAKQDQVLQAIAKKVPVIFYGTRTHKQIKQVTHEMKKTAYAKTPMSILASRNQTCVHPLVSLSKNKNEECRKVLDGVQGQHCSYYHNASRFANQANIVSCGLDTAWDIEDLVALGKKKRACPYFVTRGLKDEAQIVFCPYNYLVDPFVTKQMDLHVQDQVIILDEGHNVEDTARESASYSLTLIELEEVEDEMEKMLTSHTVDRELIESYKTVKLVCNKYINWMESNEHHLPQHLYEQVCKVWLGSEMLEEMKTKMGITPALFEIYKTHLNSIVAEARGPLFAKSPRDRAKYRAGLVPTVNMSILASVENLFIVLDFLLDPSFTCDYRVALMKTTALKREKEVDGWNRRQRRRGNLQKVWTTSLNFWCLNPAVAFSGFNSTRCVILTSGTLSPMLSFSSELGTKFPIQLEANHVITSSQVWIGTLCSGPQGRQLCASYQNTESFEFQDELGHLILSICKTIPYGVLCFFTSYKMLEKLVNRWKTVGVWEELNQQKTVVCEPRTGNKADFDEVMMTFYEAVNCANHNNSIDNNDGALFLAVFRGKVSEGLDFIDNNARAVITVGIPYPYVKDKQVELKREYNNENCLKKNLLNGSEWYEIQAYRALNQALGRCIRHKNDWGALILVDERFSKSERYTRGLSKWVRQGINHYLDYTTAQMSLKSFTKNRLALQSTETMSPLTLMPYSSSIVLDTSVKLLQSPSTSVHYPSSTPPPLTPSHKGSSSVLSPKPVLPQSPQSKQLFLHSPQLATGLTLPSAAGNQLVSTTPVNSPMKGSPMLPPLSPQTQQLVSNNPQLAGLIAEHLKLACLQLINSNQPLAQTPVVKSESDTVLTADEYAPLVHPVVKLELDENVVVPASPPVSISSDASSKPPSVYDSPPLIISPIKQPLTSTQINDDLGTRELDNLSISMPSQAAEAPVVTGGSVKREPLTSVASLSSNGIELPSNLTACDQTDTVIKTEITETVTKRRHQLRKRKETQQQQTGNVRRAAKRQYQEIEVLASCKVCSKELARFIVSGADECDGVDLVPRLQRYVRNHCSSLLIEWLNWGGNQAIMIPTSQVLFTSQLTSLTQGSFDLTWDGGTGLAYREVSCSCNQATVLVHILAANQHNTLAIYGDQTIINVAGVILVKAETSTPH